MRLHELKKLETRLLEPVSIPVIGRCLQKKAVTALAEDNSPDAVKMLAKAVTRLEDEEIKEIVLDALGKVRNRQCINAFCQVWADTRHRDLANLFVRKGWVASAPVDVKVISALKAKKLQVVTNGGQEIVEPLLNALKDRDSEIANRASEYAISITNTESIDYICQKWAETRGMLFEQLVCKGKYVAQKPINLRVLTSLKIGKLEIIRDGGKEIVEPLLKAFNDRDAEVTNRANEYAISLSNQETIDYFCHKWAENRDKLLEQLVCKGKYVAQKPIDLRVLTSLKIGKLEIIRDGGKEIVEPLLKALKDKDTEIANRANECLLSLTNSDAIDYVCQKWLDTRNQTLEQLVYQGKYIAQQPVELRVLTALKVEKLEVIKNGGKEIVEPLLNAFRDKDSEIANRANECLLSLTNSDAIDYISQKWAETRDKLLEQLVCKGKYVAKKTVELQVLTALKLAKFEVIQNCGQEIVESLLKASKDKDAEIANRAKECAVSLTNPKAIDYICNLAIEQNHRVARQIALTAQYLPKNPIQKALFYFMTEQWEKYESLDFDQTLLQKAHELANEQLRKRIAEKIRQAGRVDWLKVIAGKSQNERLEAMTDAEWETMLTVLNSGKQWKQMWQIAQKAPAIWSKKLLHKLEQAAWLPTVEQEQVGFEKLKLLADKCLGEPPSIGGLTHCQGTLQESSFSADNGMTFSPDGKILASHGTGPEIVMWRMPDGQPLTTINAHDHYVTRTANAVFKVMFSPNGQIFASFGRPERVKLWSSDLVKLSRLPIKHLSQQNREWVQKALRDNNITQEERNWLEFILALMDWHRRFDVEVEDAPQLVSTGEFDIEIEG